MIYVLVKDKTSIAYDFNTQQGTRIKKPVLDIH